MCAVQFSTGISMVGGIKVLCPANLFLRKCKDTKVLCPITWTYDVCAADTGTYCDYYWQNHNDDSKWCKQNLTSRPITGDTYLTLLYHTDVSDGLDIQSMAGLKTFVQWVDGHNICDGDSNTCSSICDSLAMNKTICSASRTEPAWWFIFLPPTKAEVHVFARVCLSVC